MKLSRFQKTDRFLLSTLAVYIVLMLLFRSRTGGWPKLALEAVGVIIVYLILESVRRKVTGRTGRCLMRIASVGLLLMFIYEASVRMTLVFFPAWRDQAVINLEISVLGVEPAVWLQRFLSPPLTEWLMFVYLFYFFLYPITGAVLFFKSGEALMEDFLWTISLNNVICNFCYFLYPVSDPVSWLGQDHFVPLKGFIFTPAGEYVRAHMMTVGGGMPSGHAAAVLIMSLMAYRHYRPLFYFLFPMAVFTWISTVYCRFHYLTDTVMGILMGLLIWGVLTLAGRSRRGGSPDKFMES